MTVSQALDEGRQALRTALTDEFATPELDARVLLQHVLGVTHAALISAAGNPIEAGRLFEYRRVIERRSEGYPVAYLVGKKEFRGLEFHVEEGVLIPRPDTETLVDVALRSLDRFARPIRILDVCTGTGCVAVALAHELADRAIVAASDVSPIAVRVARANAEALVPEAKIEVYRSDLLTDVPGSWDAIVSNPPYLTEIETSERVAGGKWKEPALALDGGGEDGLHVIRRLVAQAQAALNPGGLIAIEADPRQMGEIGAMLAGLGFENVRTDNDLAGRPRVASATKPTESRRLK